MLKKGLSPAFSQDGYGAGTPYCERFPKAGSAWKSAYGRANFPPVSFAPPGRRRLHLVEPWMVSEDADRADEAWYGAGKVTQSDMDRIHDDVARQFAGGIARGQVVIHRASSRDALKRFADSSVDYVYVDGDHSYAAADLAEAYRITKPGGFICADDYKQGDWWGGRHHSRGARTRSHQTCHHLPQDQLADDDAQAALASAAAGVLASLRAKLPCFRQQRAQISAADPGQADQNDRVRLIMSGQIEKPPGPPPKARRVAASRPGPSASRARRIG